MFVLTNSEILRLSSTAGSICIMISLVRELPLPSLPTCKGLTLLHRPASPQSLRITGRRPSGAVSKCPKATADPAQVTEGTGHTVDVLLMCVHAKFVAGSKKRPTAHPGSHCFNRRAKLALSHEPGRMGKLDRDAARFCCWRNLVDLAFWR
jgi:hypothetical protein